MFAHWDSAKKLVDIGPQSIKGDGEDWYPVEAKQTVINSVTQTAEYKLIDGVIQFIVEGDPTLTWKQNRLNAYGAIGDQLDKIFHDIEAGKFDQHGSFFAWIKEIKDKYPK